MKDMGEIGGRLVPTIRTGKKAVVAVTIEVLVEVFESDDYGDMVNQAKNDLNKRIVESNTFYPVSARAKHIHTEMKVQDLKYRTYVEAGGQW